MLDIKFIKENKDIVEMAIKNKKTKGNIDLDELLKLHEEKTTLRQKLDEVNAGRNQAAKEQNIEEGKRLKEEGSLLETTLSDVNKRFMQMMLLIPNIPSADTPIGPDESGNKVVRQWGEKPEFSFTPKAHWDLGEDLGIIDNERAAKVAGARFTFLKGDLVRLQYALVNFGMEILTDEDVLKTIAEEAGLEVSTKPFIPVWPPDMVKPAVYNRMGRLDPKEDKYYLPEDDLYLAGSAEHSVGAIHMDEILNESEMPIRYVGYSTSFRREAGSAGKDTRGILRMHQFDKLEMETFCLPEKSRDEQEFLVAIQEYAMRKLKLPYQVVSICTGDMGIPTHRQIDIEAWMPGQDTYKETHTSDLIASFQARRLNTRVKREDGKNEFVHMNDATLFSMRPLIAIMENYQEADGSIRIPEVLQKYIGKDKISK